MFSSRNYDIIIIGGGISGLFLAYKLSFVNLSILLVESSNRLGGRIYTKHNQGVTFESGAARFHSTHKKLLSLLQELDLVGLIYPLPRVLDHNLRKKDMRIHSSPPYETSHNLDTMNLLQKSIVMKDKFKKEELTNISLFQYLTLIFDHETALFMKDSFGYDSEFIELNAYSALNMFEKDLFSSDQYYSLQGGVSLLIEKLQSKLQQKDNVTIQMNKQVIDINDRMVLLSGNETFYFKYLLCAIPQKSLLQFPYFKSLSSLNSVKEIPLLRIYAKYPEKDVWFKGIQRTTTDNILRHIIPIDPSKGLIMISYTDNHLAETWRNAYMNGEDFLIKMLHKEIKSLYDIDPPAPEFISFDYWANGLHVWKPGSDSSKVSSEIIRPIPGKNIFICGESFSLKQGWIEGALETCYQVASSLNLDSYDVKIKNSQEKTVEGGKTTKELLKFKIEEILSHNNGETTLKNFSEDAKLLVMDHDGKKSVYDVSSWIHKHPGGSDKIEKALEHNKHYKDKQKYDKSPWDLFKSQMETGNHNESIIETYFKSENKHVKLVGELNK